VSGINGVEWDAIELPSQIMENWCWEKETLELISRHHQTGEHLPDEILEKLRAGKNFQSGLKILRQIELALFDFRLHLEYDPEQKDPVQRMLNDVREAVAVIHPPAFNRFAHSFTHVFGGGYAAGYYSYLWAEVLAADAFSKFEENGILDRQTGLGFLHSVLEQGGSREAMDSFVEFRGREPRIDALLRHSGIASTPARERPP
jgi:oligopeptidase A